jgi:hypothetical protein
MKSKTTVVLVLLLVGLVAYLAIRQSNWGTPAQPPAPQPQKLLAAAYDEVTAVTIAPAGGQRIALKRDKDTWQMTEPLAARADAGRAASLVRTVLALEAAPAAPADIAGVDTGLSSPACTVSVATRDGKTYSLEIGRQAPALGASQRWYTRPAGSSDTFVVEADLATQVAAGPRDFRAKELMDFKADDVTALTVNRGGDVFELTRGGTDWQLAAAPTAARDDSEPALATVATAPAATQPTRPANALTLKADTQAVTGMLRELANLRAERFIEGGTLEARGLARPRTTLTVYTPAGAATLAIGAEAGDKGATLVKAGDLVAAVKTVDLQRIAQGPMEYADKMLSKLAPGQKVLEMTLKRGNESIVLKRDGDRWDAGQRDVSPAAASNLADKLRDLSLSKVQAIDTELPKKFSDVADRIELTVTVGTPAAPAPKPAAASGPAWGPSTASAPATIPATASAPASAPATAPAASQPSDVRTYRITVAKVGPDVYAWTAGQPLVVGTAQLELYEAATAPFSKGGSGPAPSNQPEMPAMD